MKVKSSKRVPNSFSDNPQSAIQNPKWTGILAIVVAFMVCGARTDAQQTGKVFRIGLLDPSDARTSAVRLEAFWREIRKLGWIEGNNFTVESRFGEEKPGRLAEIAADLVRIKVDVIVCASTAAALAAKKATTTIPIVMAISADPVGAGLVASLAQPGGNVTGMSGLTVELNTKRLEVLKDAVPRLTRVGIPRAATSPAAVSDELQMKEVRVAAPALKLKLEEIITKLDSKALEGAFQSLKQKQVGAILVVSRPLFAERKRLVDLAAKYQLPAIYPQKQYMDEGGLMYYGIDPTDNYRRAAVYVDKILKGAKPADLPVQQATKFEFIINLKAAKQIGLTLSPEFLSRANQVIK
jgi:putative tryptophan/tyrosine transport system substrate-binding protein